MSRPRGRPPLDETRKRAAEVFLSLTNGDYDALTAIAQVERVNVQEVIRRAIRRYLRPAAPQSARRAPVTVRRRLPI